VLQCVAVCCSVLQRADFWQLVLVKVLNDVTNLPIADAHIVIQHPDTSSVVYRYICITYTFLYIYMCIYIYIYMCIYMYVYIYMSIYMYTYIYMNLHTCPQTDSLWIYHRTYIYIHKLMWIFVYIHELRISRHEPAYCDSTPQVSVW